MLFEIDTKDYDPKGLRYIRPSVRGIIIRDEKIAMVHSLKFDYYKFPGGGIEQGESMADALIREVREESGLLVIPKTIRAYGFVHRVQKQLVGPADIFVQDNYYYLCEAEEQIMRQELDAYEADERFALEFVKPDDAIKINRLENHGPKDLNMIEREARVLECLISEGYFCQQKP